MVTSRLLLIACCLMTAPSANALPQPTALAPKSKVFVDSMAGFGTDLTAALIGANVPLAIVTDRKDAELLIAGRKQVVSSGSSSSNRVEEATLTITDVQSGTVIDAITVRADSTEKLARACAARLNDHIARPPTPPAPAVVEPASAGTIRLFVQGDLNRLADFTEALRSELHAVGIAVRVVQRGDEYDYNVVFVQTEAHAGAVILDRQGLLVASALDNAFRAKGAIDGAARRLAKQLASSKRD